MKLNKLEIERQKWGKDEGKLRGVISFDNEIGKVDMNLSPDITEKLLAVIGDALVETAKAASKELTCSLIESVDNSKLIGVDDDKNI